MARPLLHHPDWVEVVESRWSALLPWNLSVLKGLRWVRCRRAVDYRWMWSSWTQNSVCLAHTTRVASKPHSRCCQRTWSSSAGSAVLQSRPGMNSWKHKYHCHTYVLLNQLEKLLDPTMLRTMLLPGLKIYLLLRLSSCKPRTGQGKYADQDWRSPYCTTQSAVQRTGKVCRPRLTFSLLYHTVNLDYCSV